MGDISPPNENIPIGLVPIQLPNEKALVDVAPIQQQLPNENIPADLLPMQPFSTDPFENPQPEEGYVYSAPEGWEDYVAVPETEEHYYNPSYTPHPLGPILAMERRAELHQIHDQLQQELPDEQLQEQPHDYMLNYYGVFGEEPDEQEPQVGQQMNEVQSELNHLQYLDEPDEPENEQEQGSMRLPSNAEDWADSTTNYPPNGDADWVTCTDPNCLLEGDHLHGREGSIYFRNVASLVQFWESLGYETFPELCGNLIPNPDGVGFTLPAPVPNQPTGDTVAHSGRDLSALQVVETRDPSDLRPERLINGPTSAASIRAPIGTSASVAPTTTPQPLNSGTPNLNGWSSTRRPNAGQPSEVDWSMRGSYPQNDDDDEDGEDLGNAWSRPNPRHVSLNSTMGHGPGRDALGYIISESSPRRSRLNTPFSAAGTSRFSTPFGSAGATTPTAGSSFDSNFGAFDTPTLTTASSSSSDNQSGDTRGNGISGVPNVGNPAMREFDLSNLFPTYPDVSQGPAAQGLVAQGPVTQGPGMPVRSAGRRQRRAAGSRNAASTRGARGQDGRSNQTNGHRHPGNQFPY